MSTDLSDNDWGDSLDDAEPGDWEAMLSGPDDDKISDTNDHQMNGTRSSSHYMDSAEQTRPNIEHQNIRLQQEISLLKRAAAAGRTAFEYALQNNNLKLLREILEAGFDPDTRRHNGQTGLSRAAYLDDKELALLLLEYDASPLIIDEDNDCALKTAFRKNGQVEPLIVTSIVEGELKRRRKNSSIYQDQPIPQADFLYLDNDTKVPFPALKLLIKHNLYELFKEAVSLGYDVFGEYHENEEGGFSTYLDIDKYVDFADAPDELMDAVVEFCRAEIGECLLDTRKTQLTSAHERIQSLNSIERDRLLQKYISDSAWFAENKSSLIAEAHARLNSAKCMLEDSRRSISEAIIDDDMEEIVTILALNPSANAYMITGEWIPEYAYKKNLRTAPLIILYFLTEWLNICTSTPDEILFDQRTALSLASEFGLDGICKALIDLGADTNKLTIMDGFEYSPILAAARDCRISTCKLLVDHGANLSHITEYADSKTHTWFSQNITPLAPIVWPRPIDYDIPF